MTKDKAVEQLIQKANAWRDTQRGKIAASSGTASPDHKLYPSTLIFPEEDDDFERDMMCAEEHELAVAIDNLMVAD